MTKEEETLLRELAAGQCVIPKVTATLGPMSLWSNDAFNKELEKARAEEREACAKVAEEANDIGSSYGIAQAIRARGNK